MSETSIEWTATVLPDGKIAPGYSFNPWWGCADVSPGCKNCYARSLALRLLPSHDLWQPNGERRFFGEEHWSGPLRWERKAVKAGVRFKVFCASMADVFDNADDLQPVREMLWELIRKTPHLDWLLLTKRIGNAKAMLPADWGDGFHNAWLGASIVNQPEADRDIHKLLALPARVRFLSCEPLLGPIDLTAHCPPFYAPHLRKDRISWVICGGESGHKARPMEWEWVRSLRDQCADAGVAFFMKQLSQAGRSWFKDFEMFPEDLQVREWPT